MKVTYNWLKDFVDIKIPAAALADKLTMAGLEVVSFEPREGDFVYEIEITSNRPDWLSVAGIAREVAAITGSQLKARPQKSLPKNAGKEKLDIRVEDKKDCPLYTAAVIRGVKVGLSPEWMRKRLELIGCRSINNIVDITNYILFETGQPLHAFDLDKLSGKTIFVRRAKKDERLVTIEGLEKKLDPQVLLIADERKALALAGVMGGKETEVSFSTKNILLEAAEFDPVVIRRSRKTAQTESDSSYRFERGIDPQGLAGSALRAALMIEESSGGKASAAGVSGKTVAKKKTLKLDLEKVRRVLGDGLLLPKIKRILVDLGFKTTGGSKKLSVKVPESRRDINLEEDLIEEIARIYGYESVKNTLPCVKPQVLGAGNQEYVGLLKQVLTGLGYSEAITYSLVDRELLRNFNIDDTSCVEVLNPLSKEQEVLRPAIAPSLAKAVAHNLNQKQEYVSLFEVAKVFSKGRQSPSEETVLALVSCGNKSMLFNHGLVKDNASILDLKGALEKVLVKLGIKEYSFENKGGQVCLSVKGSTLGRLMQLGRQSLEKLDIKNKAVFAAEVSLDKLFVYVDTEKKFSGLPKYPAITRDISLILKNDIILEELVGAMRLSGGALLRKVGVTDYYQGKQIPEGYRGLTLSCLYRSDERTLTESEVNPLHASVLNMLGERFGVKMR